MVCCAAFYCKSEQGNKKLEKGVTFHRQDFVQHSIVAHYKFFIQNICSRLLDSQKTIEGQFGLRISDASVGSLQLGQNCAQSIFKKNVLNQKLSFQCVGD